MVMIFDTTILSLLLLLLAIVVNGNHLICPTEGKNGAKIDLLLLVDQSTDYFMSSMLPAILTELQWICNCTLTSSSIKHTPPNGWYAPDIRVAIVGFGGSPRLLLPFTGSLEEASVAIKAITANGKINEASLEALRMSLSSSGSLSGLKWRSGGSKLILLFTDEDSDLPTDSANRISGQEACSLCALPYSNDIQGCPSGNRYEPDFEPKIFLAGGSDGGGDTKGGTCVSSTGCSTSNGQYYRSQAQSINLTGPYFTELSQVAQSLIQNSVSLIVYHKPDGVISYGPISVFNQQNLVWQKLPVSQQLQQTDNRNTQQLQFGDPSCNAFDNAQNLIVAQTVRCLQAKQLGQSLQGRLLSGGKRRAWVQNIDGFRTDTAAAIRKSFSTTLLAALRELLASGACKIDETPDPPDPSQPNTGSPGGIIGIAAGVVAAIGLLVIGAAIISRRRVAITTAGGGGGGAVGAGGHVRNPFYVPRATEYTNDTYERRLTPTSMTGGRRPYYAQRSMSDIALNK